MSKLSSLLIELGAEEIEFTESTREFFSPKLISLSWPTTTSDLSVFSISTGIFSFISELLSTFFSELEVDDFAWDDLSFQK